MKELDITEKKARKLLKDICKHFKVSHCNCWFIDINDPGTANDEGTLGWYCDEKINLPAYMMIEKNWSRRLILVLHEACHHIQAELYLEDTVHGKSFQLAKSRMATWARNNISDHFDWQYMLQKYSQGRRKKWKKKKRKKK